MAILFSSIIMYFPTLCFNCKGTETWDSQLKFLSRQSDSLIYFYLLLNLNSKPVFIGTFTTSCRPMGNTPWLLVYLKFGLFIMIN